MRYSGVDPLDYHLTTLDITSLYTNIDIPTGIQAAKEALDKFRPQTCLKPTNESLIGLVELVLTTNNFQFHNQHYLQNKGCAMGIRVAPSFANTHMGKFEDNHVYAYHLQPFIYLRYLDDIFLIWQHGFEELNTFVGHLNSRSDSMKFTMDVSIEVISFQDTTVKLRDRTLHTDLFCKPTDSHSYLICSSAHPYHCKKSIPHSQFLQISHPSSMKGATQATS